MNARELVKTWPGGIAASLTVAVVLGGSAALVLASIQDQRTVRLDRPVCADGSAPTTGGYPNNPVPVCQVGSIPNPPKPTLNVTLVCISTPYGRCIADEPTRP